MFISNNQDYIEPWATVMRNSSLSYFAILSSFIGQMIVAC